jgi:hypothetical protein
MAEDLRIIKGTKQGLLIHYVRKLVFHVFHLANPTCFADSKTKKRRIKAKRQQG